MKAEFKFIALLQEFLDKATAKIQKESGATVTYEIKRKNRNNLDEFILPPKINGKKHKSQKDVPAKKISISLDGVLTITSDDESKVNKAIRTIRKGKLQRLSLDDCFYRG